MYGLPEVLYKISFLRGRTSYSRFNIVLNLTLKLFFDYFSSKIFCFPISNV